MYSYKTKFIDRELTNNSIQNFLYTNNFEYKKEWNRMLRI